MKSFVVFALLVVAAAAVPLQTFGKADYYAKTSSGNERDAQTLSLVNDNIGVEGFKKAYETSNGIKEEAQGQLVNAGAENEAVVIRGSYSYPGPDGVVYTVTYIADENGFQPQGAHLPVAPQ